MPKNLSFYADEIDSRLILRHLNDDDEIAWIVPPKAGSWVAKKTIGEISEGEYVLWHVLSGPLPLLQKDSTAPNLLILNPWKGWNELRAGENELLPYFGPGHPGAINLKLAFKGVWAPEAIAMSYFGWIGNWYRRIGTPAPPATEKWWKRLHAWMKKSFVQVPRSGNLIGNGKEIWALPSAYEKIKSGMARDSNPWVPPNQRLKLTD